MNYYSVYEPASNKLMKALSTTGLKVWTKLMNPPCWYIIINYTRKNTFSLFTMNSHPSSFYVKIMYFNRVSRDVYVWGFIIL